MLTVLLTLSALAQQPLPTAVEAPHEPLTLGAERRQPSPADGYKAFGAQVGFFGTAGATVVPAMRSRAFNSDPALAVIASEAVWFAGGALTAKATFELAKHYHWDTATGWGAAAAVPGAYVGMIAGAGLYGFAGAADEPNPAYFGAIGVGALGGAAAAYLQGRRWSHSHNPGGELAWMWGGAMLGLLAGVAASQEFTRTGYGSPPVMGVTSVVGAFAASELSYRARRKRKGFTEPTR